MSSYVLYYFSIPPRSGPYWDGVCEMIVLEKIALVNEATTFFLIVLILILVGGLRISSWAVEGQDCQAEDSIAGTTQGTLPCLYQLAMAEITGS